MRKNGLLIVGTLLCSIFFLEQPIVVGADEKLIPEEIVAVVPVHTDVEIEIIEVPQIVEESKYIIDVTDEEIDLMARVVMSESSILCNDAKQAVAQTIVNRVRNGRWGDTVTEVINYPSAYSTQDNGDPTGDCYYAVMGALMYEGFPTDMYYFKADSPHDFGFCYMQIDNTYFTTETNHLAP